MVKFRKHFPKYQIRSVNCRKNEYKDFIQNFRSTIDLWQVRREKEQGKMSSKWFLFPWWREGRERLFQKHSKRWACFKYVLWHHYLKYLQRYLKYTHYLKYLQRSLKITEINTNNNHLSLRLIPLERLNKGNSTYSFFLCPVFLSKWKFVNTSKKLLKNRN